MVKTIAVDDKDHKRFRQIAFNVGKPMNVLFHEWVEEFDQESEAVVRYAR